MDIYYHPLLDQMEQRARSDWCYFIHIALRIALLFYSYYFKKIALEECFCMNLHISASFISLYLQAMVWKRLLKSVMSANIRLLTNSGCCFKGHSAKEGKNRFNNSRLTLIKGKLMYTGYTHQREASLLHPWARLSWGISKWINRLMLNFPLTCLHWHK